MRAQKKGNLSTPTGEQAPINTPEANSGTVSKNNVAQDDGTVKHFSMRDTVEETKDLVAVHNLTEDKLLKSLKLGGLPMPSIAVIRAREGHGKFGNISLVFGKDTIDPQRTKYNKVYSGDAWTPMFPKVDYMANPDVEDRISKKYEDLSKRFGDDVKELQKYTYDLDDKLDRDGALNSIDDAKFSDRASDYMELAKDP